MENQFISLSSYYNEINVEEMHKNILSFRKEMQQRRTVRDFSDRTVPIEIIEECLLAAGSAPSGANMQPWHFVVVSEPEVKRKIRITSELNENEFYSHKATKDWLEAITPLNTNALKPFLEIAPYLIVVFAERNRILANGKMEQNYYVSESVGIATGFLITAIHKAGLVSLTYTPSPMNFLNSLLYRPDNERAFMVLAVGYPAENAMVPNIKKKSLEEIASFL